MQSKTLKIISLIDRIVSQAIVILFAFVLCVCIYVIYDSIRIHNETKTIADASNLIQSTPDETRITELKKTNSEIAEALSVSERTVKFHIHNILKKTGCRNRNELLSSYLTCFLG